MSDMMTSDTQAKGLPHATETGAAIVVDAAKSDRPRSLGSDAWRELRRRPLFIVSLVLILLFGLMAAFPQLFTSVDPTYADLNRNLQPPKWENWFKFGVDGQFGYDILGRDVYARTIYGARASIIVGLLTVLGTTVLGGLVGLVAGYFGGWVDSLMSRFADIFLGVPLVLGSLLILSTFASRAHDNPSAFKIASLVIIALVALGWPVFARIMRSSVIATKQLDYVAAARALGARPSRIIFRHVLPNAVAPLIVVATISIGSYIGAEATLSFLGVGLQDPVVSWGVMISGGITYREVAPHMMLFPGAFLTIAVLSFVMLGDAVRDALDPKLR
jgi:oligopeptide transport system permease protein